MPSFSKKTLSLFLRTGCQRQLLLNLYSPAEKEAKGMPPRQEARSVLGLVGQAGYDWQAAKVWELEQAFGRPALEMGRMNARNRITNIPLVNALPALAPYRFLVEGSYGTDTATFRQAVGLDEIRDPDGALLGVGNAEPDLIQVLPPMLARDEWEWEIEAVRPRGLALEVLPSGDVRPIPEDDDRLRLRVIDIKQAAEPGANYLAEVVLYSLTLSAWLVQNEMTDRYVVVAAPAVWPGSYAASLIMVARQKAHAEAREPTPQELARALEEEVEVAPIDVFVPRILTFFREELPRVLATPWQELPWHVSYPCKGCDYLGYPWRNREGEDTSRPEHCKPTADMTGHLSRVVGLTRGGATLLNDYAPNVQELAQLNPSHPAFDATTTLRAKRTLYPRRAHALEQGISGVIRDSGGDALMPRWPDLRVFVFIEYDLSTAVTASFGLRAAWTEPLPFGSALQKQGHRWRASESRRRTEGGRVVWRRERTGYQEAFIVDQRDPELRREREELLRFLHALRDVLTWVRQQDDADVAAGRRTEAWGAEKRSTYQIYLWDRAQRKHLERVMSRHLGAILADPGLRDLAWLIPPPELLGHPEDASYKSPFTYVSTVVENTVALPIPYHYTLLDVVGAYRSGLAVAPTVHPLYQEPMSDLVPGERLHEMWSRRGDIAEMLPLLRETTERKLDALALVSYRLERDLAPLLHRGAAPPVVRAPARLNGVPPHSELWNEFARLNAAVADLDAHATRAMPANERVARFKSAQLLRRLEGGEKQVAYDALAREAPEPLPPIDETLVYTLSDDSRELNARPPAFFTLVPTDQPSFLNDPAVPLLREHNLQVNGEYPRGKTVVEAGLTKVTLLAIDRVGGWVALKAWNPQSIAGLEAANVVDLSADVMLDPLGEDFSSKKIRETLQAIGNPPSAVHDAATLQALGYTVAPAPGDSPETAAAAFLWGAGALAQAPAPVALDAAATRAALEAAGRGLDESQWRAWEAGLTRRLTLVWGPPGTGKSRTLRAVMAGAALNAHQAGRPLRILISAFTYRAADHVLFDVAEGLRLLLPPEAYTIARVRSQYAPRPDVLDGYPEVEDVIPRRKRSEPSVAALQALLSNPDRIVVVSSPPQQLYNLAVARTQATPFGPAQRVGRLVQPWFDLVIVDEASQMDVATSTLVVSKTAEDGTFVLAGDDLQLAPIHQAEPPKDLDALVGSVFSYARYYHGIEPMPLQTNYRSNETVVTFTRRAGYDPGLHAYHSNLRLAPLNAEEPFPVQRPADWPDSLYWSPGWAQLLDTDRPATCFVYQDDTAGQANDFEADAVAAILRLLYERVDGQLAGELDENGQERPATGQAHDPVQFWSQGVGVVTPHRAQMGKIVGRLQRAFPNHDPRAIWGAVDTVERFQGQERDVIVASFGLGDPDLIRLEDEFLYQLNRFNVMASRARAKLIVLVTRSFVDHLADSIEVLEESRLLKYFVEGFCQDPEPLVLGYLNGGALVERPGVLRTRV